MLVLVKKTSICFYRPSGIDALPRMGDEMMDKHMNPAPKKVFMYGADNIKAVHVRLTLSQYMERKLKPWAEGMTFTKVDGETSASGDTSGEAGAILLSF